MDAPLIVAGPLGAGRPELTDATVGFNGGGGVAVNGHLADLGCETFRLDRVHEPEEWQGPDERGWYFECWKTRRHPYDLAVTASLVRLAHRFPEGVEISSHAGHVDWRAPLDRLRQGF